MRLLSHILLWAAMFSHCSPSTDTESLKEVKLHVISLANAIQKDRFLHHQELKDVNEKLKRILSMLEEIQSTHKATPPTVPPRDRSPKVTHATCRKRVNTSPTLTHVNLWNKRQVLCDMETDCGGWFIIQRRTRGDVNFYKRWVHYKEGFGSPDTDYWAGLDTIHNLTRHGYTELRIDMHYQNRHYFAHYSHFLVGPESSGYPLTIGDYYGTAGDSLKFHNGSQFSTYDVDNDKYSGNCAEFYHGAGWYVNCYHSNLNGLWAVDNNSGMVWRDIMPAKSVSFTEIKVRRP